MPKDGWKGAAGSTPLPSSSSRPARTDCRTNCPVGSGDDKPSRPAPVRPSGFHSRRSLEVLHDQRVHVLRCVFAEDGIEVPVLGYDAMLVQSLTELATQEVVGGGGGF